MKTDNINDILFDVEKVKETEMDCLSACSHTIIGYPNGIKTKIQTCSDTYALIPNASIFPVIRQTLMTKGEGSITESYEMTDHSMFVAKIALTASKFSINMNGKTGTFADLIFPQVIVYHSYNGARKYIIKFGFYRLVCTNGLTVPVKELEWLNLQISGKHTEKINTSIEMLMSRIDYILNNFAHLTDGFNLLKNETVVNWSDRVIEVMAQAGISKGYSGKGEAEILTTIRNEANDLYDGKVSNWVIYNGINRYLFNDEANKKIDETREQLDRKVMSILMA